MSPEDYRRLVSQVMFDSMACGRERRRAFRSSGTVQASAVADALTRSSFEGLSVYSGKASADVWNPGLLREHAMRAPSPVRMLVDDDTAPVSPGSALTELADLIRDGLVLVRATVPTDRDRKPHIVVSDGRHVRVEAEKAVRRATTVFGDRDLGRTAQQIFDTLWGRALPVGRERLSVA